MRRTRIAAVLVGLLVLSACDDERDSARITEPLPLDTIVAHALFQLHASYRPGLDPESPNRVWRLAAVLDPGHVDGLPRAVNDTVWIDTMPLKPTRTDGRIRYYRAEIGMEPTEIHEEPIRVTLPAVEGLTPPAGEIRIVGIGRGSGDVIEWTPGTDLLLPLSLPASSTEPPADVASWSSAVWTDEGPLISLRGTDPPPGHIRIPAFYLSTDGSPMRAGFGGAFAHRSRSQSQPGPSYILYYHIEFSFNWSIEITAPTSAATTVLPGGD